MERPLRVLIIEDSEEDTQLLLRELGRGGYEVEFERVETAEAMQPALAQKTWDLILSDYTMPKFNALKALEVLEASHLDLPFIIISGTIGEETAVAALKAGANDFLVKGKFARLGPAIERELREAESRRERRHAEEARRASEKRFRRYFELGLIGMAMTSPDKGFIEVNDRICEILGYQRAELMQIPWDSITHPDDLAADLVNFNSLLAGEINGYSMEKRFIHKDGWIVHTAISVNSILRAEGSVDYLVVLMEDITERKRAEEALRENEDRYRALFEDMPVSIWEEDFSDVKKHLDSLKEEGVTDFRTYIKANPDVILECNALIRVLDVNQATLKLYRADSKEDLFKSVDEIPSERMMEQLGDILIAISEGRNNYTWEGADETIAGEPIEVNLKWSVAPGHEIDFSKVIVTTIDITERKHAEQEIKKQLDELQRWHNATLGRETRVLDLKREVNELLGKAGQPPRYASAE